jgi:hypothetical protein
MGIMKQITIKDLRLCPYYFEFFVNRVWFDAEPSSVNLTAYDPEVGVYIDGTSIPVELDEEVWVDEKTFKNAMLNVVKEIMPTAISISKVGGVVYAGFSGSHIRCSIDPMPWKDQYVINFEK